MIQAFVHTIKYTLCYFGILHHSALRKKPLSTSKNVLFTGQNHLLTTGADDPTLLIIVQAPVKVIINSVGSSAPVVRWRL